MDEGKVEESGEADANAFGKGKAGAGNGGEGGNYMKLGIEGVLKDEKKKIL